jgi:hypothetical protein
MAAPPSEQLARRLSREERAQLRGAVDRARAAKRARINAVRAAIRRARARLADRLAAFRAQWREWVNERVAEMRADAERRYRAAREKARARGNTAIARAEAELAARDALEQRVRMGSAWKRDQLRRGHGSTFSRRQESDEQVRNNLPAELQPVWERFKSRVQTRVPGKSRTEAFVEWVSENEADVVAAMGAVAERQARETFERGESEARYLERLEREQRRRPRAGSDWVYSDLDAIPF